METPPAYAPEFLQMQHAWPINAAGGLSYYARSRLRARWAQARACRAGARAWSGLPACPAITLACAQPLHACSTPTRSKVVGSRVQVKQKSHQTEMLQAKEFFNATKRC